jgi:hypothetical protein
MIIVSHRLIEFLLELAPLLGVVLFGVFLTFFCVGLTVMRWGKLFDKPGFAVEMALSGVSGGALVLLIVPLLPPAAREAVNSFVLGWPMLALMGVNLLLLAASLYAMRAIDKGNTRFAKLALLIDKKMKGIE